MIRLFILIFALNTLLSPIGFAAMSLPNANNKMTMNQEQISKRAFLVKKNQIHCVALVPHNNCNHNLTSDMLCKVKCAEFCSSSPACFSILSFNFPFFAHPIEANSVFTPFYTRSIPPELRPPLA